MPPPGEGSPWASGIRGVINDLIDQGLSARQGLQELRDVHGMAVRDQTFYNLWSETSAARANAGIHFNADYAAVLNDNEYSVWSAGRPGTYIHQVGLEVRDVQSGKNFTLYSSVSSSRPMTRADAVDQAIDNMEQGIVDDPSGYPLRVRGGYFMNAYKLAGRSR